MRMFALVTLLAVGCGVGEIGEANSAADPAGGPANGPSGTAGGGAAGGSAGTAGDGGTAGGGGEPIAAPVAPSREVTVHLTASSSAKQRINFAVPFGQAWLTDEKLVSVVQGSTIVPFARRVLAKHRDGSIRSVQIQFDLAISSATDVKVRIETSAIDATLAMQSVDGTLTKSGSVESPKVWALLPATWLSASAVGGLLLPVAETPAELGAWEKLCNYDKNNYEAFVSQQSDSAVWLYDRPTTLYRGYFRRGDAGTLASAYKEVSLYRAGIKGSGTTTSIGLTDKTDDLKYYYAQGLAMHYLLTGDDRYREAAESIADRASKLFTIYSYKGSGFWTERHAGFGLLAFMWASVVSDDKAATYVKLADDAVTGLIATQARAITGYTDTAARCFHHSADSHGEDYGYDGCSSWMSAILADGLEFYVRERDGAQQSSARDMLVKLGRFFAQKRPSDGKPYYWNASNGKSGEEDPDDEHWGESAYLAGLAYFYSGRTDSSLRDAALALDRSVAAQGSAPHMRSFNWQCRTAVATSYFAR